jgi:uncharacterized protein (UPF0333 family)
MKFKAQATMEFLLSFLLVVTAVGLLSLAIFSVSDKAEKEASKLSRIVLLEQIARLHDNIQSAGMAIAVETGNIAYRVEGNSIVSDYGNKTISINGVSNVSTKKGEAI